MRTSPPWCGSRLRPRRWRDLQRSFEAVRDGGCMAPIVNFGEGVGLGREFAHHAFSTRTLEGTFSMENTGRSEYELRQTNERDEPKPGLGGHPYIGGVHRGVL